MISFQLEGYYSNGQCKRIKEKLEGQTFMNFHIEFGGIAGNNTIVVSSDNEDYNSEELKEMFIYRALTSL